MKLSTQTHDLIAPFDVWKHVQTDTYAYVYVYNMYNKLRITYILKEMLI